MTLKDSVHQCARDALRCHTMDPVMAAARYCVTNDCFQYAYIATTSAVWGPVWVQVYANAVHEAYAKTQDII